MNAPLVLLTGASGAGKTTLAQQILRHESAACTVLFFDSIGVPSPEIMTAEYGTGEAWQHAMILKWMAHIRPHLSARKPVLLEGQMRIAFLQEALTTSGITNARIVLLDCDDATRTARLHTDRSQPELANSTMMNWAKYLREEAIASGIEILDTSYQPLEQCLAQLRHYLFEPLIRSTHP